MSAAPERRLLAPLTAVTVFRRGALVTRTGRLDPLEGAFPDEVRIEGLPLNLDEHSVRVRLHGAGRPTASDVRVELAVPGEPSEGPPADTPALVAARKAEAETRREVQALETELEMLERLQPAPRPAPDAGPPPPCPIAARLALLELREARRTRLRERLEAARSELESRVVDRQAEEAAEREASSARKPELHELRKSVIVKLRSQEAASAPVELELRYAVSGARWAPSYTLHLDPELRRAELAVRALVRQRTDEDWSNVQLTLSTADQEGWSELPELKALRIGRAQPPPTTSWRAPPLGTEALYASFDQRNGPCSSDLPAPLGTLLDEAPQDGGGFTEELEGAFEDQELDSPPFRDADDDEPPQFLGEMSAPVGPAFSQSVPSPSFAGGPPPAPPPPAKMRRRSALPPGAPPPAPARDAPPPVPEIDDELLRYGQLVLRGPKEARRGQLVKRSAPAGASARGAIAVARARSERFEAEPPSPGHVFAHAEDGFHYAFTAQHPVSLPSDGKDHLVPLSRSEAETSPRYLAVPRESRELFRVLELHNPMDAPILPAPMDVYIGEAYQLTADVAVTPPRGQLELGLGVESSLELARNVRFEEQTTGLIRGSLGLVHEISLELRNHLPHPAQVEIRERIPVPSEAHKDKLEVHVESVEPGWAPREGIGLDLEGVHAWRLEVPAGELSSLFVRYIIRIPASQELVGGNRREA